MSSEKCKEDGCSVEIFKDGYCVDHFRKSKTRLSIGGLVSSLGGQSFDPVNKTVEEITSFFLSHHKDLERKQILNYHESYKKFITSDDNQLDYFQTARLLESLGMTKTYSEISKLVAASDINKDGRINFFEFLTAMHPMKEDIQAPVPEDTGIAKGKLQNRAQFFEQKVTICGDDTSVVDKIHRDAQIRKSRKEEEAKEKIEKEAKLKEEEERKRKFKEEQVAKFQSK